MNLLGAAVALSLGTAIDWSLFVLFQVMVSSDQLAGAVANELADEKTDGLNKNRTWFSGGSGEYAKGKISRRMVRSLLAFWVVVNLMTIAATIAFYEPAPWVIVMALLGLTLALSYSLRPLQLSYRGIGELAMACMVSFLAPATSFALQYGGWDNTILFVTVPLMFQMMGLMMVVEYPDLEADLEAGKRNIVVRLGRDRAWRFGLAMLVLGALSAFSAIPMGLPSGVGMAAGALLLLETAYFFTIESRARARPTWFWSTGGAVGFYILVIGTTAALLAQV